MKKSEKLQSFWEQYARYLVTEESVILDNILNLAQDRIVQDELIKTISGWRVLNDCNLTGPNPIPKIELGENSILILQPRSNRTYVMEGTYECYNGNIVRKAIKKKKVLPFFSKIQ